MSSLRKLVLALALLFVFSGPTFAHNVWCHCAKRDAQSALDFIHKAGEVYVALADAMAVWDGANRPLETGVLAEMEHIVNGTPIEPGRFVETLVSFQLLREKLAVLQLKLEEQRKLADDGDTLPEFDMEITRILQEQPVLRLSREGVRYADIAGEKKQSMPIVGLVGVIDAQIADLVILREVLEEVIDGTRNAIPLAEKAEFARVMLSGRNEFGDKVPQFTDMIYTFQKLYVQTCMASIAATMQTYPKGFTWLEPK
ncbi:hypothetical protein IWQ55_001347 [Labrenzia sp. EL_208]|nr:hypothetical protein [Labrenzia sp. EL_132]MBG6228149.1 hypothetical protein [Labrenzia sp. EL_208]